MSTKSQELKSTPLSVASPTACRILYERLGGVPYVYLTVVLVDLSLAILHRQ